MNHFVSLGRGDTHSCVVSRKPCHSVLAKANSHPRWRKHISLFSAFTVLVTLLLGSHNAAAQSCSGTTVIGTQSGTVTDGSGASQYSRNLDCNWLVDPAGDDIVRVEFTEFDVSNDEVYVYDGTNANATLLGVYSGTTLPPVLYATSGSVFVNFDTDFLFLGDGWSFNYSTLASLGCQGDVVLEDTDGQFEDGSGDANYNALSQCSWTFPSVEGQAVMLQFTSFDVHSSDLVSVYDGTDDTGVLLADFTGSTVLEHPLFATSGNMHVLFHTDESDEGEGWNAQYQSVPLYTDCDGSFEDGSGDSNYENNVDQYYVIRSDCGGWLLVDFTSLSLGLFADSVSIYDGNSTNAPLIGRFSTGNEPEQVLSTTGSAVVHFVTDGLLTSDGWSIEYSMIEAGGGCSGHTVLTEESGVIEDGSLNLDYFADASCSWTIESTTGNAIGLNFTEFDLGAGDVVSVFDGGVDEGELLASFTGAGDLETTVYSLTGTMYILFSSDETSQAAGWKANYFNVDLYKDCEGTVDDGSGESDYENNLNNRYIVRPDCGGPIRVEFTEFSTQWNADYVYLYDGLDSDAPLLGQYSFNELPPVVYATSGTLLVRFETNGFISAPGWEFEYSTVGNIGCQGDLVFTESSGRIDDGSGSEDYSTGATCTWHIQSTTNQAIVLTFDEFDVHASDEVSVYDGENTSGVLLGTFTGSSIPGSFAAVSGSMFVAFDSDESDVAEGWGASFVNVPLNNACEGSLSDESGEDNYANSINEFHVIHPDCDGFIVLDFTEFELAAFTDEVVLYDGPTTNAPTIASYEAGDNPSVQVSTTGTVLIQFTSDLILNGAGWTLEYETSPFVALTSVTPNTTEATVSGGQFNVLGSFYYDVASIQAVTFDDDDNEVGSGTLAFNQVSSTNLSIQIGDGLLSTTGSLVFTVYDEQSNSSSLTINIIGKLFGRHDYSESTGSHTIAVMANDDAYSSSILSTSTPNWGTTAITGNTVVYTPTTGFHGLDNFEYTFGFEGGVSSTGTITVYTRPLGTNDRELHQIQYVSQGGEINRLKAPRGAVVSPDGEHVYVAAYTSRAVNHFTRTSSGTLTYIDHVSANNQGLNRVTQVAMSPDGRFLYTASRTEYAIGIFSVSATTGSLTYVGKAKRNVDGVDGLKYVEDIVVSPDGRNVYSVSSSDRKLTVFLRNQTTGTLSYVERFKDGQGGVTKMHTPRAVDISPDGKNVYVAAYQDNAVSVFSRAEEKGKLTFVEHQKDGSGGIDGLMGASGVSVSPDGEQVFVTGYRDNALAVFDRNSATGALTFVERFKDGSDGVDGLNGAYQNRVAPTGQHVFAAAKGDNAVSHFKRNTDDGSTSFEEFVKRNVNGVQGLYNVYNIAVDPQSNTVYAMSNSSNGITVFELSELERMSKSSANSESLLRNASLVEGLQVTNLYPLPAQEHLTVQLKDMYADVSVSVFDQAGRLMLSAKNSGATDQLRIDCSNLTSGVYFMLLEGESDGSTQTALVEFVK